MLTFGAGKAGRHALARGTNVLRTAGSRVRNALGQTLGGERAPYTFRA